MKLAAIALAFAALTTQPAAAAATPIPTSFESSGADRVAINALLATYTRAVSTKDEALFETLLLDRSIPFSGVPLPASGETRNYADFRNGVFHGAPFTQRFQDVHIVQDGPLAQVSLVFTNSTAKGSSWGLKTLQLLKAEGRWKIASEFYTFHG